MRYPLLSASGHSCASLIRLVIPEDAIRGNFLGPQFVCRLRQSHGLHRHQDPSSSSLQVSGSHFLWEKEIQANLGNAPCRGGWHHVQIGKAIFNCYICSSTHLSQPQAPPAIPFPPSEACPAPSGPCVAPAHPAPAVQLWSGPQAIFCLVPKIIQLSGMCV